MDGWRLMDGKAVSTKQRKTQNGLQRYYGGQGATFSYALKMIPHAWDLISL